MSLDDTHETDAFTAGWVLVATARGDAGGLRARPAMSGFLLAPIVAFFEGLDRLDAAQRRGRLKQCAARLRQNPHIEVQGLLAKAAEQGLLRTPATPRPGYVMSRGLVQRIALLVGNGAVQP